MIKELCSIRGEEIGTDGRVTAGECLFVCIYSRGDVGLAVCTKSHVRLRGVSSRLVLVNVLGTWNVCTVIHKY